MNDLTDSSPLAGLTSEEYERIRAVFEPMRQKFARLAALLPAEARPAVTFETLAARKQDPKKQEQR